MAMGIRGTAAPAASVSWRRAMKRYVMTAVVAALMLPGCVPGYVKENDSPVLLLMVGINGGETIIVDVSVLTSTSAAVTLAVRAKNPKGPTSAIIPMHVALDQYSVRFFRTDGQNVEGQDVPFSFSSAMAGEIDLLTSGGSTFNIPLVRAQAKQEPPLRNLRVIPGITTNPLPGAAINPVVTMIAEITVYGHTFANEKVSATGRATVDFTGGPLTATP
jgi:hypothetical protein